VKGLCEKYDGIVYLTARDVERGEAAVSELEKVLTNSLFNIIAVKTSKLAQHTFIGRLLCDVSEDLTTFTS